jgi:hypothetical protein
VAMDEVRCAPTRSDLDPLCQCVARIKYQDGIATAAAAAAHTRRVVSVGPPDIIMMTIYNRVSSALS